MRRILMLIVCVLCLSNLTFGQVMTEAQLKTLVPYAEMQSLVPGLTYQDYEAVVRRVVSEKNVKIQSPGVQSPGASSGSFSPLVAVPSNNETPKYIGTLSSNPFAANSTSNTFGPYGSPFSPNSVNNQFGIYGSPYSPNSASNPFATDTPQIVGRDGQYLGKLSTNPFDPDSVSNPFGKYGSPFSPTSINNPFSVYGSRFSPLSPNNPFATQSPILLAPQSAFPQLPTIPVIPPLPALPTLPTFGK